MANKSSSKTSYSCGNKYVTTTRKTKTGTKTTTKSVSMSSKQRANYQRRLRG